MGFYTETIKNFEDRYKTAEDVIRSVATGDFVGCCLIPVLPTWKPILGEAIWVVSSIKEATRKRQNDKVNLVFTSKELLIVIEAAMHEQQQIKSIVDAKRLFSGVIEQTSQQSIKNKGW